MHRFQAFAWPQPSTIGLTILLAALSFVVLAPIYLLLVSGVQVEGPGHVAGYSLAAWRAAFSEPGIANAFLNTLIVMALVQAISIPMAILIAWVIARTDMPGARFAELLFWVTFFIPTLAVTSGWILVWDPKFGLGNQMLIRTGIFTSAPFSIYSLAGIVFTHLTSLSISTKVMMMAPAFRNLDASLEEAARMSGAGPLGTLFRIVVPASMPMVCVASLMSLIRSFESFEVELVLGTPFRFSVYSTKIYSLIHQTPVNYAGATALSMLILTTVLTSRDLAALDQPPAPIHDPDRSFQTNLVFPGKVALAGGHRSVFSGQSGNDSTARLLAGGQRDESLWPFRT